VSFFCGRVDTVVGTAGLSQGNREGWLLQEIEILPKSRIPQYPVQRVPAESTEKEKKEKEKKEKEKKEKAV
jgi:hypothetical protein